MIWDFGYGIQRFKIQGIEFNDLRFRVYNSMNWDSGYRIQWFEIQGIEFNDLRFRV